MVYRFNEYTLVIQNLPVDNILSIINVTPLSLSNKHRNFHRTPFTLNFSHNLLTTYPTLYLLQVLEDLVLKYFREGTGSLIFSSITDLFNSFTPFL